jgi:hypothetical protein
MADYYPLIAKAVSGLDKSTGETRRALYDRARTALLAQLRGVEPALSEPDITRERLALEEAIRKVEGEIAFRGVDTARRARGELLAPRPESDPRAEAPSDVSQDYAETPRPRPAVAAADDEAETEDMRPAIPLSAAATARVSDAGTRRTERWSHDASVSDNGVRSFRDGIGEGGPSGDASVRNYPTVNDDFGGRYEQRSAQGAGHNQARWADQHDEDDMDRGEDHPLEQPPPRLSPRDVVARPPSELMTDDRRGRGQSFPRIVRPERLPVPERAPEHPSASGWSAPRNTNRIVAISVIGLLALGLAGVAYWFGDDVMGLMRGTGSRSADQAGPADNAARAGSKINDRAPSATGASEGALVAQKVVLYEEDPSNPNGIQYGGAAVWRTEQTAPVPGQKPDVVIRAEIEVPEQKLSVRLSLRRNDDKQLPASHTVEIVFTMPPDFPHGGIDKIPGIMMKQGETTRGVALNGVAVKVTNNYFLVGLLSADADMARNVQLLKERSWFDIPVVYADGKRALIAIEKGIPGERAFADAFAAWEQ